ncbi:MAG: 3-oxoacyl-ACP reductase FabG [Gemmatimonadota bacterium]|nr:3-oxoacyl-ACP reductase FabG [Gemmatimonadota bacterium]
MQGGRRLEGRTALVTGASRGIGRAVALELGREGAQVVVNYLRFEEAASAVSEEIARKGGKALVIRANVGDPGEVRSMVDQVIEECGQIDILVNNAGVTRDRTLRKLTDVDWLDVININLNSVYFCTSAVVPVMTERRYGRIVNIASFVAQAGNFGQTNYAASKGGMIAFTKAAALELAKYGITVNVVAPGFIRTEMLDQMPQEVLERVRSRIPLGHLGEPADVARAVAYLCIEGDYVTGQQINVNGGLYM